MWLPVLEGADARDIRSAIDAVLYDLEDRPLSMTGWGASLLVSYHHLAFSDVVDVTTVVQSVDRLVDTLPLMGNSPSLYSGFTGVAWTCAHLGKRFFETCDDTFNDIDAALMRSLSHASTVPSYDLIGGLVGIGVYFTERLASNIGFTGLRLVVEELWRRAERSDSGMTWLTRADELLPETRVRAPVGLYNVGVAHGVPGVIALLGFAYSADILRNRTREMLARALEWTLSQRTSAMWAFPCWVDPQGQAIPSRLAWCYGGLGVAVSLLATARWTQDQALEDQALSIAKPLVRWTGADTGVVDAGLCHGSAGVAALFNRLYQATGDSEFADAARLWFKRTLNFRLQDKGVGGFQAWTIDPSTGRPGWIDEPRFLTGASGIALALIGAITNVEPEWDMVLLSRIPA